MRLKDSRTEAAAVKERRSDKLLQTPPDTYINEAGVASVALKGCNARIQASEGASCGIVTSSGRGVISGIRLKAFSIERWDHPLFLRNSVL
jgi:hypothetical protein